MDRPEMVFKKFNGEQIKVMIDERVPWNEVWVVSERDWGKVLGKIVNIGQSQNADEDGVE